MEVTVGRRNKAYYKDLHQQAYDKLVGMQAFGESKRAAVVAGTDKEKIFSFNTYKSYWKHTKYFIQYIKEHHPECTTLKSARKYVNEWLQARADQGLSAWTVQLEAKAMGKLYGISPDDENYFKPPKRNREDIKRSRGDRVRDRHFSKTNNDELIKFCKGTGLRRSELAELRGKDLVTRAQIEAEISSLESRPTAELTPADVKRLGMLQDARLFQGEYFTHVRLCMEEHSLPITGLEVRPEIWPQHDVLSLRLLRLLVILRLFKQLNLFSFLKHRRIAARIKTINPYSANQALPVLIHPCQFICNLLANQPLRKIYGIGALYYCFPQHHPCHIFSFSITMLFLRRENYTIPGMLFLRLQFPVGIRPLSGNP